MRQATSRVGSIEKQLTDRTSESGLHEAKLKELQEELESRTRRIGELEGTLEAKDIELKESTSLVDRVKVLHGEQCHELQKQIEEVRKRRNMCTGTPFHERNFTSTFASVKVFLIEAFKLSLGEFQNIYVGKPSHMA